MNSIRKDYLKAHGYLPSDDELLNLYRIGELSLTDAQENELLKYFNM